MKAIILAAGKGTRLRPLTYSIPKCMVPIAGKPILHYTLMNMARHGITDVVLTTGYLAYQIQYYFSEGSEYGLNILYTKEKELLGTAGGIKRIENFFNDDFFLIYGDNFTTVDITAMRAFHEKHGGVATVGLYREEKYPEQKGNVELNGSRLLKFVEKPSVAFSTWVNAATFILKPEIFKYIPHGKYFDFSIDLIPMLLEKGIPMHCFMIDYLKDIGLPDVYNEAQEDVKNGMVKFQ